MALDPEPPFLVAHMFLQSGYFLNVASVTSEGSLSLEGGSARISGSKPQRVLRMIAWCCARLVRFFSFNSSPSLLQPTLLPAMYWIEKATRCTSLEVVLY